ncbi:MAG: bifunctional riboflavin kinase/FAD synthetase [Chloroflexi bacterium]|nr:bifunctional riboflavin kinase/FAD synthetase [Chloroflexota bacterium]
MKALEELQRAGSQGEAVATIGVFDGVHRGHQHLLRLLRDEATRRGVRSAVLTFVNHPRSVLQPETETFYISPLQTRLRLLLAQGVDLVVPLTFDLEFSHLKARDFLALLQKTLRLRGLVVGPDFAMGHQREGTAPVLQMLGREMGIEVCVVEPLASEGLVVSSTAARQALGAGDVVTVARLLGRPFCLEGRVTRGEGRGHVLGFPTANLEVSPDQALPCNGIYATWAGIDGVRRPSATSIGVRPTFGPGRRTIEAFVMDFQGDLYSHSLELEFASRLRGEERFDSVEALLAQMRHDVGQARRVLQEASWMLAG